MQTQSTSTRATKRVDTPMSQTFGRVIADARGTVTLRDLAAQIKKGDGFPISPQYLNDLEHDRRNPPSDFLLQQFAQILQVPLEILYYHAGRIPPDLRDMQIDHDQIIEAYNAFRCKILGAMEVPHAE